MAAGPKGMSFTGLGSAVKTVETQLDELRHKNRELQAVLDSEVSVRAINI